MADSGWVVARRQLGHYRFGVVHHHCGHSTGYSAFKMAGLTLTPFSKTVEYGGGVGSVLLNIIWFVLAGLWMAIGYILAGLLNCVTIIGIPFGIQSFKMAKLALWPFGSQIRSL